MNDLAIPGQKLGSKSDYLHGEGTYLAEDGFIYASSLGKPVVSQSSLKSLPSISIPSVGMKKMIPDIGSTVLAIVHKQK